MVSLTLVQQRLKTSVCGVLKVHSLPKKQQHFTSVLSDLICVSGAFRWRTAAAVFPRTVSAHVNDFGDNRDEMTEQEITPRSQKETISGDLDFPQERSGNSYTETGNFPPLSITTSLQLCSSSLHHPCPAEYIKSVEDFYFLFWTTKKDLGDGLQPQRLTLFPLSSFLFFFFSFFSV